MTPPSLSATLTCYNHARYVGEALEAILSQSRPPDELIVVDDASTDSSLDVIQSFARRSPRVRVVRNPRNCGPAGARIRALEWATGDYLYNGASDDRICPGFFERSLDLLARHPHAGLSFADSIWFDDRTGAVREKRHGWSRGPAYLSPAALAARARGGAITGHTCIVRRRLLMESACYPLPAIRWHADWFAMHVIAFRYGLCYLPDTLARVRVHPAAWHVTGMGRVGAQHQVLRNVLALLNAPVYRDIRRWFERGGSLSHFHLPAAAAVLTSPRYWDASTLALLQYAPWMVGRKIVQRLRDVLGSAPGG